MIDAANFRVLSPSSEIELKFYMNAAANVINQSTLTGTPILNWSGAELLVRCTRMPPAYVQNEISQIIKQPKHYLYHRTQYAPYALNSGITNTTITLSTFNGNLSHLFFFVRENTKMTNLNQWEYMPITSYEIKDSAGTSLTGGKPILDRESRLTNSRFWTKSSYLCDTELGVSNSNVYLYSFSADPQLAYSTGSRLNSKFFTGQETIHVIFPTALSAACTLEVFGYQESTLEHSAVGIKVLAQ